MLTSDQLLELERLIGSVAHTLNSHLFFLGNGSHAFIRTKSGKEYPMTDDQMSKLRDASEKLDEAYELVIKST